MRRLFRPWATDGDKLTLAQQVRQKMSRLQTREAGRKRCLRSHAPAGADHAHARCRAKLRYLLADAARADNASGLVPDNYRIVSLMIEPVPPLVSITQMKA